MKTKEQIEEDVIKDAVVAAAKSIGREMNRITISFRYEKDSDYACEVQGLFVISERKSK